MMVSSRRADVARYLVELHPANVPIVLTVLVFSFDGVRWANPGAQARREQGARQFGDIDASATRRPPADCRADAQRPTAELTATTMFPSAAPAILAPRCEASFAAAPSPAA
jgi:hypothetical protein